MAEPTKPTKPTTTDPERDARIRAATMAGLRKMVETQAATKAVAPPPTDAVPPKVPTPAPEKRTVTATATAPPRQNQNLLGLNKAVPDPRSGETPRELTGGQGLSLESIEPGTGAVVAVPGPFEQTNDQFQAAKNVAGTAKYQYKIAGKSIGAEKELVGLESNEDVVTPSKFESIAYWFEPTDYGRMGLWHIANFMGDYLPDPTEEGAEPTLTSQVGDALQNLTGKLVTASLEGINTPAGAPPPLAFWEATVGRDKDDEAAVDAIGENLYKAASTGKLYERGSKERGYERGLPFIDLKQEFDPVTKEPTELHVDWPDPIGSHPPGEDVPGWAPPYPKGTHILDEMIPVELARKLEQTAQTDRARWYYQKLQTPLGREVFGAVLEFAIDPMWLAGPAKGVTILREGEKAVSLAAPLARAAQTAADINKVSPTVALRHMYKLMSGTPDEVALAQRFFDEAIDAARLAKETAAADAASLAKRAQSPAQASADAARLATAEADQLAREVAGYRNMPNAKARVAAGEKKLAALRAEAAAMSDATKAADYLQRRAKLARTDAKVASARLEGMRRAQQLVATAERGELAKDVGGFAWHLPFAEQSRYLTKGKAVSVERVASFLPDPLAREVVDTAADVERWFEPYTIDALHELKAAGKQMSTTQEMAWHFMQVTGQASTAMYGALDGLRRVFGSRFIQPAVAVAMADLEMSMKGRPGAFLDAFGETYVRLRKVNPELWNTYHDAVTQFWNRSLAMEQMTRGLLTSMARRAKTVWKDRTTNAKAYAAEFGQRAEQAHGAAMVAAGPERLRLLEEARSLRWQQQEALRWADKSTYKVQNVIDEAWDVIERGSFDELNAGLKIVVDEVDVFRRQMALKLGKDVDLVNQALVAMARFAEGDVAKARRLREAIKYTGKVLDDVTTGKQAMLASIEAAADARITQVDAFLLVIRDVSMPDLAEALEQVQRAAGSAPFEQGHRAVIRDAVLKMVGGDQKAADDVFRNIATAMGEIDPELALRKLADLVDMGDGKPGEITVQAVRDLVSKWTESAQHLRSVASGRFNPAEEGKVLSELLQGGVDLELAAIRGAVGAKDWPRFVAWARGADVGEVPEAWAEAKAAWLRVQAHAEMAADAAEGRLRLVTQAVESGDSLSNDRLWTTRFKRALDEAKAGLDNAVATSADTATANNAAVARIRAALDELLPTHVPAVSAAADGMARSIADRLARGLTPLEAAGEARARAAKILGEIVSDAASDAAQVEAQARKISGTWKALQGNLERELLRVQPRFRLPDEVRNMASWEEELYAEWKRMTQGLSDEDQLLVSMTALRFSPGAERVAGQYEAWAKAYGQAVGRRMDEVPAHLGPVVRQARSIIASMEEAYEKFGVEWMKNPVDRLRQWGVRGYVPHIAAPEQLIANGQKSLKQFGYTGQLDPGIRDIDDAMMTKMDAAKTRAIRGTVREINADPRTATKFTFDPHIVAARYGQSIQALSAQEFLSTLVHGGVARRATPEEAAAQDLVPMFSRSKEHPEFARWVDTIPELKRERAVKDLASRLDSATVSQLVDQKAWRTLREMLNRVAGDADIKVKLEWVEAYFEGGTVGKVTELYVPRVVYQSMVELFNTNDNWILNTPLGRAMSDIQNFWKTRITVVSLTFSVRNSVSNVLSNILDVGVHGAMSPMTNFQASRLAVALQYADHWGGGSLVEAIRYLDDASAAGLSGRGFDAGMAVAARQAWKMSARKSLDLVPGLRDLIRDGVDLGDGVRRPIDEALQLLRDNNIVSGAHGQFVDIAAFESSLLDTLSTGKVDLAKRVASGAEDFFLMVAPQLVSGGTLVPVGLPKFLGSAVARHVENQGRLVNFIANMRRGAGVTDSAAHVQKFLFNYSDLSVTQKTWMRMLIPFWTWSAKNVGLHLDMITKSPAYYAKFNQLAIVHIPAIMEDLDVEEGGLHLPHKRQGDDLWSRMDHTLSKIRIPIPESWGGGSNQYIEGIGTPIEAAIEQFGLVASVLDLERSISEASAYGGGGNSTALRFAGQMNFLTRSVMQHLLSKNFYYNRNMDELTNGDFVGQNIAAANRFPIVGYAMGRAINELTGYHVIGVYDRVAGSMRIRRSVRPHANALVSELPWTRVLRDAAAMSDLYHLQAEADLGAELGGRSPDTDEVDRFWRVVDAYFGARVVQEDPTTAARIREYRLREQQEAELKSRGALRTPSEAQLRPLR